MEHLVPSEKMNLDELFKQKKITEEHKIKMYNKILKGEVEVEDITKRDTYVETVKLRAEVDVLNKQTSALWDFCNKLRDKFTNGGH